jgi:hypothetical protein
MTVKTKHFKLALHVWFAGTLTFHAVTVNKYALQAHSFISA